MNIYSITYDLKKDRDYGKLHTAIRAICKDNWAKPTESNWLIVTDKSATQINGYLSNYIDNDDVLMVIRVDINDCDATHIPKDVATWLGLS